MSKFCHFCGAQVPVGAKFCGSCGTNLSSLANKPAPEPVAAKSRPGQFTPFSVGREDDDGDSYIDKLTHLDIRQNELQVEIVKDRPLGESVGAVVTQGMNAGAPPSIEARPALDPKASLESFRQEAGTLRNEK